MRQPSARSRHATGAGWTALMEEATGRSAFAALALPNYRRYFFGQAVSLSGTWMQMTAQSWLVLSLSHSSTVLGVIIALQALPVLLLGPYGGVVADRVDKRRLIVVLQAAMSSQALILAVLTLAGIVRVWEIGLLATLLGVASAFESPTRQSFMHELVGAEHLRNAVTLGSVLINIARTVGPAIAGVLIATVGTGICFLLNAASFIAVVGSLLAMDVSVIERSPAAPRARGQLREGLRYISGTPQLGVPLLMIALVSCFAYSFPVSLPVMASRGLRVGATGYGFMTAAMGVGGVIGGLVVAARGRTGLGPLVVAALSFGVAMTLATFAPSLSWELAALGLTGVANLAFMSTGNATLQLTAEASMRGRVMSLWFVAFQGSAPIGGPIVGWVMAVLGARAGLGLGAVTCVVAAAVGAIWLRDAGRRGSSGAPTALDRSPGRSPSAAVGGRQRSP